MRRLILSAVSMLLLLACASQAHAGWGHYVGWQRLRHVRHWHHFGRVRHYTRHWVHRPHIHRHYVHRHYVRRYYTPRYYYRPRYYVHRRYSYPSYGFSFGYTPTDYYYQPPVRYYSYPYCASATPALDTGYSYSMVSTTPALTTPTAPTRVEPEAAANVAQWVRLAQRLISEVSATGENPDWHLVSHRPSDPRDGSKRSVTDATRLMAIGDGLFQAAQYAQALAYYEAAARTDQDLAAAHFRLGHAYVAVGEYGQAVVAMKRGLSVDEHLLSKFRLQDVYRDEQARSQHVEALAAAALRNNRDGDVLFLIGVFLHFEGQTDRAEKFLHCAAELVEDDSHIQAFLRSDGDATPAAATLDERYAAWSADRSPF